MNRNLAALIMFAFCVIGPGFVFALGGIGSIQALGRSPSSAPKVLTAMLMSLLLAQFVSIIAILTLFFLLGTS